MNWWSCPAAPVLSQWRLVCRVLASLSCGTVSPQAPLLDHLLPAHSERMYGKTLAVESVVIAHTLAITKWSSTVESMKTASSTVTISLLFSQQECHFTFGYQYHSKALLSPQQSPIVYHTPLITIPVLPPPVVFVR